MPIICLMFVFSLNITAQITLLKIILPILYIGNKITAGILPAREMLSILSAPTKSPVKIAVATFFPSRGICISSLLENNDITKSIKDAIKNARVSSCGNSLAKFESWCTFWSTAVVPEPQAAKTDKRTHFTETFCDF